VIESPPSSTADQTDSAVESEFAARRRWGADWVRESGRRLTRWDERGVFGALVIVFCFASIFCPNFLNVANLASILQDITFLGFLAVGMTFALLAGEIDISVGSTFGLVAVVTALLFQHGSATLLAILGGLAVGLAAGFVNGIAAVSLGVPAIIVTLATLGIYRTFSLVLTHETAIGGLPEGRFFFSKVGLGTVLGSISWLSIMFLVAAVIAALVLKRTPFGFRVYSVGSNPAAARLVGMNVTRIRVLVLTISGLMAAIAGVLSVAYLDSATATEGSGYELDALAAVIIGGAKLSGGRGTITGTTLGLFIVGIIRNMLVLASVSTDWQQAVAGVVLIGAVAMDRFARRKERRA
jgi:ribose/xylose/arabinose/galactoside ABC-type transport system permease subunit